MFALFLRGGRVRNMGVRQVMRERDENTREESGSVFSPHAMIVPQFIFAPIFHVRLLQRLQKHFIRRRRREAPFMVIK